MDDKKQIEVYVDVTAKDYRRVLLWYFWKRILLVGLVYIFVIPVTLWFVAFGAGASPLDSQNKPIFAVFTLLGLLPILLVLGFYFSIWRQAKKVERISEKSKFVFNDKGIETQSNSTSSQMLWERLVKIFETKTDFVFFPQENIFYAIPKHFFTGDEQILALRSLLVEKIGNKARLRR